MRSDPSDLDDVHGFPLRGMLPRPVPFRYRLLDADERAGRGRIAVRLLLLGFPARSAWLIAMADESCWREHLPNAYQGRLIDRELPTFVMQRRLMDIVRASDWECG